VFPTTDFHPATVQRSSTKRRKSSIPRIKLPKDKNNLDVEIDDRVVKLTNLNKLFWPKLHVTKRDLIGARSIIGANALVTIGTKIPPGSLVLGSPAKIRRQLTLDEQKDIARWAWSYVETAKEYREFY
jgi:hypothetical protein